MYGPAPDDPVWYVAYGSNLRAARFGCYLAGGRPRGARRTYEGCRDRTPSRRDVGLLLPGRLCFAGVSRVWGGGIAFYDLDGEGQVAARAYLVTFGQFSDVVAQEARRPVGTDLVLGPGPGRSWPAPSGVYESVIRLDDIDGLPSFSITSRQRLASAAPSAPYLRAILEGLAETFDWSVTGRVDYLLRMPGVGPRWSREELTGLCADARPPPPLPG
jgi:hypothetical protein